MNTDTVYTMLITCVEEWLTYVLIKPERPPFDLSPQEMALQWAVGDFTFNHLSLDKCIIS